MIYLKIVFFVTIIGFFSWAAAPNNALVCGDKTEAGQSCYPASVIYRMRSNIINLLANGDPVLENITIKHKNATSGCYTLINPTDDHNNWIIRNTNIPEKNLCLDLYVSNKYENPFEKLADRWVTRGVREFPPYFDTCEFDVRKYGAKCDEKTDDSYAIIMAYNEATPVKQPIFFPGNKSFPIGTTCYFKNLSFLRGHWERIKGGIIYDGKIFPSDFFGDKNKPKRNLVPDPIPPPCKKTKTNPCDDTNIFKKLSASSLLNEQSKIQRKGICNATSIKQN